ncbi:hypothetical protein GLOTRDRAFT_134022 [Gloeophyllum trabeum ATCC 11539]|uniref:Uncharacterized protein n=1 Tax=Gloeophyllum trabeum (strain ATCC 11539 / FP-39264 / Madison 617) TaxID=670483 RepID=S7R7K1_GLOTA|nr:uncharacterized protein GLOTRDRAFT_134022 [Gloeophyllum trabeum ATCC 11539]EPQ50355.1 hypothetical protein GLOTRDRAFT_134022 [Gloeophyllum trabeum ATCC 11539]
MSTYHQTRDRTRPSFDSSYKFFKKVDEFPTGPEWTCEILEATGDQRDEKGLFMTEKLEVWHRNPVECIKDLIGNPAFREVLAYVPEWVYADRQGRKRVIDEAWTADWWLETQKKLPSGAVIAPIILASDKTQLSLHSGDKAAWPVYLTIGNIAKHVHHQPSAHATVLIGYIPTSKLECFTEKYRSLAGYRLFHDFLHDQATTAIILERKVNEIEDSRFESQGLHPIWKLFWVDLPFTDIFACFTPDILHQLHKGIFKDHLVNWICDLASNEEIDARFKAMMGYPGLRHFAKGISSISQWTGNEHCQMTRVVVAIYFIYYAQYQRHTSETLALMQQALDGFHQLKDIFIDYLVRKDFNIPKFHALLHYIDTIHALGTADEYTTELPEHLHIEYAKKAYHASNKKDYEIQMAKWLQRQDAMARRTLYIDWVTGKLDLNSVTSASRSNHNSDVNEDDKDDYQEDYRLLRIAGSRDALTTPEEVGCIRVARKCPYPATHVDRLEHEYGVVEFIPALQTFLAESCPSLKITPNRSDVFDVYKTAQIHLPPSYHLPDSKVRYTQIHAIPSQKARDARKSDKPSRFDLILAIENRDVHKTDPRGIHGLRVAEVRVIFTLPPELGGMGDQEPLVYVRWFRPLQSVDPMSGMFRLVRSTHQS